MTEKERDRNRDAELEELRRTVDKLRDEINELKEQLERSRRDRD